MKSIALLALLTFPFLAQSSEVLLNCSNAEFEDLQQILITREFEGELKIIEISRDGLLNTFTQDEVEFFNENKIQLSDWNGHRRELVQKGNSWRIFYHDGCSGGSSLAICK